MAKLHGRDLRELLSGTLLALGMKGLSAALTILFNIIIARTLGAEGTGLYFLSFTVVMLAGLVSRLGLDQAIVQLVAAHATTQNWSAIRGIYRNSLMLGVGLSLGLTFGLIASAPLLSQVFAKPALLPLLRWSAIAIAPLTVMVLHAQLMQGMNRIILYGLLQWQGIGISILSCLGVWALGTHMGLMGAVWALDGAAIVMMGISIYLSAKALPELQLFAKTTLSSAFPWQTILAMSWPLFWVNLCSYMTSAAATGLILGLWWTSAEVGVYSLAARTAQLVSFVLVAANTIAAPKFAALYHKQQLETLALVSRRINLLALGSALPLIVVLIGMPHWIMAYYGASFKEQGAIILQILAVGQIFNVATGSVGLLLAMCQQAPSLRTNTIYTTLLNIGLTVVFVPLWGIKGAAIADSSSMMIKNISALYLVKQKIGLRNFTLFRL